MSFVNSGAPSNAPKLIHVANFAHNNAGDVVLPLAVRAALDTGRQARWKVRHAHRVVDQSAVDQLNRSAGVVIGGGGLFLSDTNPNTLSGWQWSCSVPALRHLEAPLAVFAVGYNRFRNQGDFKAPFAEHVSLLLDKAAFFGLRNQGSIAALQEYVPEHLRDKIRFQPCPTTILRTLVPSLTEPARSGAQHWSVALNCAFDREGLRYGHDADERLRQIAQAVKVLSATYPIRYYAHVDTDDRMLPYLDGVGVPYTYHRLYKMSPAAIVRLYSQPALTIGMRGHAQMIPAGCGRPILSLASHEKLWYFLRDIGATDWGLDVTEPDLADAIVARATSALDNLADSQRRLDQVQTQLADTTAANVRDIWRAFSGASGTMPDPLLATSEHAAD